MILLVGYFLSPTEVLNFDIDECLKSFFFKNLMSLNFLELCLNDSGMSPKKFS